MMRRIVISLGALIGVGIVLFAAIMVFYFLVPHSNANLARVDVLIILGCPTMPDGSLAPEQRERVDEGVREFKKGVSSHLIITGGAAHDRFVEAHSMATLARESGVPATAITEEVRSIDTIQNIYFSNAIMRAHGWHTTEVISSPSHLARAALILKHYPELRWKTHAARWPKAFTSVRRRQLYMLEAVKSFRMIIPGFGSFEYLPPI